MTNFRFIVVMLLSAILVSACASNIRTQPRPRPDAAPVVPQYETIPGSSTQQSGRRLDSAESAWALIQQAETATSPQRESYLLDAAETLLNVGQISTATTLLENLQIKGLPPIYGMRKLFLSARVQQYQNNHVAALQMLQQLNVAPDTHPQLGAKVLLRQAESQSALGQNAQALQTLSARQRYLFDSILAEENLRNIWRVVRQLSESQLQNIRNATTDPDLRGWADLGVIHRQFGADSYRLQQESANWQVLYPGHPGRHVSTLAPLQQAYGFNPIGTINQIGLLLPLSSNVGRPAQAVYDGFMAMHDADTNPAKPSVVLYDIGQQAELVSSFYTNAINQNADVIVGPLGKDAVDNLVRSTSLSAPTLLLGAISQTGIGSANAFQFSLQPEQEAQQVARRAFLDGHRVAGVLFPESAWGRRMQFAFTEAWQQIGGLVAEEQSFGNVQSDYSTTIKALLNLDVSEARRQKVSQVVGTSLKFNSRRRDDIDFIFLAANAKQARLIKPQINFHHAHNLPVYATSHVYTGVPDKINDADLNGLIFCDMPWVLIASERYQGLKSSLRGSSNNGPMARLFALGADAYELVLQLNSMQSSPEFRLNGATATLSMAYDGQIERQLVWAKFTDGVPQLIDRHAQDQSVITN